MVGWKEGSSLTGRQTGRQNLSQHYIEGLRVVLIKGVMICLIYNLWRV